VTARRRHLPLSNQENLTRRLQKEAKDAPEPRIHSELVRRLEELFAPQTCNAYQQVLALPEMDAIDLRRERTLLVMSPDSGNPPRAAATLFSGVVEKNNRTFSVAAAPVRDTTCRSFSRMQPPLHWPRHDEPRQPRPSTRCSAHTPASETSASRGNRPAQAMDWRSTAAISSSDSSSWGGWNSIGGQ
jgi:hypothetical protein